MHRAIQDGTTHAQNRETQAQFSPLLDSGGALLHKEPQRAAQMANARPELPADPTNPLKQRE